MSNKNPLKQKRKRGATRVSGSIQGKAQNKNKNKELIKCCQKLKESRNSRKSMGESVRI